MSPRVVPCGHCDNPMALGPSGWGRCRLCGYESLRDCVSVMQAVVAPEKAEEERASATTTTPQALGLSFLSTSRTGCVA